MENNNLELIEKNQQCILRAEKTINSIKELNEILTEIENGGN